MGPTTSLFSSSSVFLTLVLIGAKRTLTISSVWLSFFYFVKTQVGLSFGINDTLQ